jgi:GT2 family glycosyltransferase
MPSEIDVVIPTIGRPSLTLLLAALDGLPDRLPAHVIVVDDRRDASGALPMGSLSPALASRLRVKTSGGRGPAAARNVGWRASNAQWIVFLDDDVVPCCGWMTELQRDLAALPADAAASQARVHVPMPLHRRPTDHERTVRRLETARWTATDIAYRRRMLERLGGFDERLTRAHREDADLGLRARDLGQRIVSGTRTVVHPVWPASPWTSVHAQAGNADDAMMRRLHGPHWRRIASVPAGDLRQHLATMLAAVLVLAGTGLGLPFVAGAGALAWLGGTAAFAWSRIAPGPRTPGEIATMIGTSFVIPPAAMAWRLAGEVRAWQQCPAPIALRDAVPLAEAEPASAVRMRPPRETDTAPRRDDLVAPPEAAADLVEAADRFAGHHA